MPCELQVIIYTPGPGIELDHLNWMETQPADFLESLIRTSPCTTGHAMTIFDRRDRTPSYSHSIQRRMVATLRWELRKRRIVDDSGREHRERLSRLRGRSRLCETLITSRVIVHTARCQRLLHAPNARTEPMLHDRRIRSTMPMLKLNVATNNQAT
nr:hypothetical protein CFP56_32317 [Quercus suber]